MGQSFQVAEVSKFFLFETLRCRNLETLFTVQFHNQLLIHRQLDIFALGQRQNASLVIVAINFQPVGDRLMAGKLLGHFERRKLAAVLANRDFLALANLPLTAMWP